MNHLPHFIQHLKSFSSVSDETIRLSLPYFRELELQRGDFLVKAGEICNTAGFIHSGILRTFYINEKGEDVTYCFCDKDRFTTSLKSFVEQSPSLLSIQAMETTCITTLSYESLQILYATFPEWQEIGRLLMQKEYLAMESYASSLNFETAKEKYLRLLKHQPAIVQRVPVQYIASYLGVSRETLSRIRSQIG